jgi:hypothetical protein
MNIIIYKENAYCTSIPEIVFQNTTNKSKRVQIKEPYKKKERKH